MTRVPCCRDVSRYASRKARYISVANSSRKARGYVWSRRRYICSERELSSFIEGSFMRLLLLFLNQEEPVCFERYVPVAPGAALRLAGLVVRSQSGDSSACVLPRELDRCVPVTQR